MLDPPETALAARKRPLPVQPPRPLRPLNHQEVDLAAHMAATLQNLGPTCYQVLVVLAAGPATRSELRRMAPAMSPNNAGQVCHRLEQAGLVIRFNGEGEDAVYALSAAGLSRIEECLRGLREAAVAQADAAQREEAAHVPTG